MASWSSENATKAYLQPLKIGKSGKEPDAAEFISAIAAGNNAQLMVIACEGIAGSSTLALLAAGHQTCGRVVCILPGLKELHASQNFLGHYADFVEFALGEARTLLLNNYKGADFVLIDCNLNDLKGVFLAAQKCANEKGAMIVGYNALQIKGQLFNEWKFHFLPIGEGLLVRKIKENSKNGGRVKRSLWVVKVDECTGEEHFYRITAPNRKQIKG